MGTKLHGTLNLYTTLVENQCATSLRSSSSNNQIGFDYRQPKIGTNMSPDQFQRSMDRSPEQQNRESLRKIMLKHEEIFTQQVNELHRLYKAQKVLMAELRNKTKLHPFATPTSRHHSLAQSNSENTFMQGSEDCSKTKRLFDPGRSAKEETRTELWTHQDCKAVVLEQLEECDIELTLSIRCGGAGVDKPKKWHDQGKESRCSKLITSSTPVTPDGQ